MRGNIFAHPSPLGWRDDLLEGNLWTTLVPEGLPYCKGKKLLPETPPNGHFYLPKVFPSHTKAVPSPHLTLS